DLTGPARAMSIRAHNDAEAGLFEPPSTDADVVWVSPADILAKRHIPLPAPVAAGLRAASAAVIDAATTAAAAASQPTTSTKGTPPAVPTATRAPGHRVEPREPPRL